MSETEKIIASRKSNAKNFTAEQNAQLEEMNRSLEHGDELVNDLHNILG